MAIGDHRPNATMPRDDDCDVIDGMAVEMRDWVNSRSCHLIHADRHGAVVIRPEHIDLLPEAVDEVMRREAPILEAARSEGFDLATLLQVWSDNDDVH